MSGAHERRRQCSAQSARQVRQRLAQAADALTAALLARYREGMTLPNAFAHTAQEREAICLDAFLRAADPVETLLRLR